MSDSFALCCAIAGEASSTPVMTPTVITASAKPATRAGAVLIQFINIVTSLR